MNKLETEIIKKEHELAERAKDLEPEEHITFFNIKDVVLQQKSINYALTIEKEMNSLLQKEKESLNQAIKEKDAIILSQNQVIQIKHVKLSEFEKELLREKDRVNDIFNIKVSNEQIRNICINEAKRKVRLFDRVVKLIQQFLPQLKNLCPKFIQELIDYKILENEESTRERENI